MAELNPRERLQPFLLDRLTDDQPDSRVESREKRVLSPKQLQASILRDLSWLLNAKAHPPKDGLEEFPELKNSVLNYGIVELTGQTASSIRPEVLERMIATAIKAFEPRIQPGTLQVKLVNDAKGAHPNALVFEIKGQIMANPLPEPLYIKTEVDLETGQFAVK